MLKNRIPPAGYIVPAPVVLVGTNVKGKPNFNAIGLERNKRQNSLKRI